jgi:energy-coupling factor transporter ATP-binding protein EcfA2
MVVASPRYFSGAIPFGMLTQTVNAFGRVQGALSWFVDTFASLADWKATTDRLTTFSEAMAVAKRAHRTEWRFDIAASDQGAFALNDVELDLPDGRLLLRDVNLTLESRRSVVIQGPSGGGKTTLFRAIAGIWPFGRGRIRLPRDARVLFLPQRPYLPLGTLREVLSYPDQPDRHDDVAYAQALEACRLPHLLTGSTRTATGRWRCRRASSSGLPSLARCCSSRTGCSSTRPARRRTRRRRPSYTSSSRSDTDLLIRAALFVGSGIVRYRDAEKRGADARQHHYKSIESSWEVTVAGFKEAVRLYRQSGVPKGEWLPYRYLLLPPAVAVAKGGLSKPKMGRMVHRRQSLASLSR